MSVAIGCFDLLELLIVSYNHYIKLCFSNLCNHL